MSVHFWRQAAWGLLAVVGVLPFFLPAHLQSAPPAPKRVTASDCNYLIQPDDFLAGQSRARNAVQRKLAQFERMADTGSTADASTIPHRNFIDSEIFGKMARAGVRSAPVAADGEFLRRVLLDLTGRIPSPDDIRAFTNDADPDKRQALVQKLLNSSEFTDKWTWWISDLLQVNAAAANFSRGINGRNAYFLWVKAKVGERASLREIAMQSVNGSGTNYLMENGASNFAVGSLVGNGPAQDTYDLTFSKAANAFLGLGYFDCLVCHNGRGHLDALSLWAKGTTRLDAQRMSAFFARQNITNHPETNNRDSFYAGARMVGDRTVGSYDLNTTNGNRPPRCAPNATISNNRCSAIMGITPEYYFNNAQPAPSQTWREAFAYNMSVDPMFARNFANRLWKEMFNLGLVDPVDTMDPARLDPNSPPPDGWSLQATHPELLEKLAANLRENNYDLREFLRLIVNSSAYQLSSRYSGEWKLDYVPLFARHYPRRLEAEEIHDAVVKATGVMPTYTVQSLPGTYNWALQLPDPSEPRNNGGALTFMNPFLRGNRDTQQRSQAGSILQKLTMMNDAFVLSRSKVAASPVLRALANNTDNTAVVEEMFLVFLNRAPSAIERTESLGMLTRAANQTARNTAVEDLAWVLMNKVEFQFSY